MHLHRRSVTRRFLSRLLVAMLGMLVFCLTAYLGLGWAVREQKGWLLGCISDEWNCKLYLRYNFTGSVESVRSQLAYHSDQ